ncbi:TPA: amino acid permease [Clostridioides difficile]|nr:amino acid permease [Clostridioides difficile]
MEKKKIGLWSLVFMNVSALYGIRWIAKSTASSFGLGLGAIPMWLLFSFIYFVPGALICAELASTYQKGDGGLYDWVKEAFGEKYGFLVSWLNWTAKIFWYSSFLTFLAVNVSYTIGNPALADNKMFVLILSLIIFWALSLIATKGISFTKIFTNTGALGSTIPSAILIIFSFVAVFVLKKHDIASTYTIASMTPKLNMDAFVAISAIMFGLAGAETVANFITEIDKPEKNFPKAILISAGIVASLYVLGSIAITMIIPPDQITASKGVLDALSAVCASLGIGSWLVQLIAFGIAFSVLGAIVLYIASPIKMLFGSVKKGIFPDSLVEVNEHKIPSKAVILQAIIVTIILLVTTLMPSVDAIYNVLVTMTALTALFPYVLLYASYIKLRKERPDEIRPYTMAKSTSTCLGLAKMVLVVTVVGILLSAAPVMPTFAENVIYEIEMIGGGLLVILSGLWLWNRYEKKTAK